VFCTPAEACAILDERPVAEAEEQPIEQAPR
jgi:hypothetical protein